MAIQRKEIRGYLGKVTIFFIRTSYRSVRDHPFVLCFVFFLFVLYKSFPSLFSFLAASSPTIICTTILLGLLLSYGEQNVPESEEDDKSTTWEVSSVEIESFADYLDANKEKKLVEDNLETRNYNEETEPQEAILNEKARPDEDIYQTRKRFEGNEKLDTVMETRLLDEELKEGHHVDNEVIQEEDVQARRDSNGDVPVGKLAVGLAEAGESMSFFGEKHKLQAEGLKLESGESPLDCHLDSSLGLRWKTLETHHVPSDNESDRAESSSPDASMTDIIPMLDELHPLLDSEHPLLARNSKSDAASEVSSQDHESLDSGTDEEAENHGGKENDEEALEKDDETEAVQWTEDDLMNVIDLGSSELERNQKLESLIAKQRAKKSLTFAAERNDLNVNNSFLNMDELSHFHVQVPPVSAPRKNPFDSISDFEEKMDLPPIPLSAPPSLVPRSNPFDLIYDLQEQNRSLTGESWGQQDFGSAPHHEILIKRNETLSPGRKEFPREKRHSRFKPYFSVESRDLEEGSSTFQRQFSDTSESKVSSVAESHTLHSVTDEEDNGDAKEQELQNETESSCPSKHDAETPQYPSHTSEKVEPVDTDEKRSEHATDVHVNGVEENSREVMHLNKHNSDFEKLEVVETKYDEPRFSFSPDNDEKGFITSFPEQKPNLEQTRSLEVPLFAEPEILTSLSAVHEFKVEEPAYHSINKPPVTDYFHQARVVDDCSPDAGHPVYAGSLVKFDVQKEASETIYSTRPLEEFADLAFTEENESPSREIAQVSHDDGTKAGESAIQEHFSHPPSLIAQEMAASDSGLTGLQITNASYIDASSFQNSVPENGQADDSTNLFQKIEDISSSDISRPIPIHHGSLTGLSMDFSVASKRKSQTGIQTSGDLSRSQEDFTSAALTKMVDSSDEESDEVYPVVLVDDMDDNLQMELEGVDFHIEELPSNHQVSELMSQIHGELQGVDSSRSILYTDINQPCESSDDQSPRISSVIGQSTVLESEIGSSLGSTRNLDQTLHNTEERLVDSASNHPLEEATAAAVTDPNTDILTTTKVEPNELEIAQTSIDQTPNDSELVAVEATSIEDIHSALGQITEESIHKIKQQISEDAENLVAKMIQSDLVVSEAKSTENLGLAFNQLSDSTSKKAPEPMKTEDESPEVNASERQLETEILDVVTKTSSNGEPFSEKRGAEAETSTVKTRKKTKKSASSSSSSSSSSSDSSNSDSDEDKR